MLTSTLVPVILWLAVAAAQDLQSAQPFIDTLTFTEKDYLDAFTALNVENSNEEIDMADLDVLFYNRDSQFAKTKFLQLIDTQAMPTGVNVQELASFMQKESVKLAIHECKYIRSQSVRRFCFADQILTYVYLVMDQDSIEQFFNAMESRAFKDRKLNLDEIKALKSYDPKFDDVAANYFLMEIGQGSTEITLDSFSNYVRREDLNDHFRECKTPMTDVRNSDSNYDNDCLIKGLLHYTMDHLTEYMTALVFSGYDAGTMLDNVLDRKDIELATGGIPEDVDRFFDIIDKSKDGKITYGEFRAYVQSHSVKYHLERECLQKESVLEWHLNRHCIKWNLYYLIKENHRPMWMGIPDLDMLFLFEELDADDDGIIDVKKDLIGKLNWDDVLAGKFGREIKGPNSNGRVNLEEFNFYVDEPNMVYGLGDCLIEKDGQQRFKCYAKELVTIVQNVLEKHEVNNFLQLYDSTEHKNITREKLVKLGMNDENLINTFLLELGMGDDVVTQWEFTWFVKQQELSSTFTASMRGDPKQLHEKLLKYLQNIMTEYATQRLFRRLDSTNKFELVREDIPSVAAANLIWKMNVFDRTGRVSFIEFWLFLNTPSAMNGDSRKRQLESACTKTFVRQDDQMNCYVQTLPNVH